VRRSDPAVAGSPLEQAFQQADQDQDKNLSMAEFDLYKQQQEIKSQGAGGQQGGGMAQGGGQQGGQQGGGMAQGGGQQAGGSMPPFAELDADNDGVLSQGATSGSPLGQAFQQADQDQDSNLSMAEYDLYKQQQQLQAAGSAGQQEGGTGQGGGAQQQGGSGQQEGGSAQGGGSQQSMTAVLAAAAEILPNRDRRTSSAYISGIRSLAPVRADPGSNPSPLSWHREQAVPGSPYLANRLRRS
jgi:hypothetical protein